MQQAKDENFWRVYKELKREVWTRDNYVCRYCGLDMSELYQQYLRGEISRTEALITVDHVKPKRPDEPFRRSTKDNLVTACISCNKKKGGYTSLKNHQKSY